MSFLTQNYLYWHIIETHLSISEIREDGENNMVYNVIFSKNNAFALYTVYYILPSNLQKLCV